MLNHVWSKLFYPPGTEYYGGMYTINSHNCRGMEQRHTPAYPFFASVRGFSLLLLLLASLAMGMPANATPNENDSGTIRYLLEYVRTSNLTFKRNLSSHTSIEAASHIQEKYQHFREEIESPEDFIDLCASKSLITGSYYLIIDEQGRELRTRDWLMEALASYRNEQSRASTK